MRHDARTPAPARSALAARCRARLRRCWRRRGSQSPGLSGRDAPASSAARRASSCECRFFAASALAGHAGRLSLGLRHPAARGSNDAVPVDLNAYPYPLPDGRSRSSAGRPGPAPSRGRGAGFRLDSRAGAVIWLRTSAPPILKSRPMTEPAPSPAEPLLRVEGLSKRFGPVVALDQVSFAVRARRGRGPARRQRRRQVDADQDLISGSLAPSAGRIWFDGRERRLREPGRGQGAGHRDGLPGPLALPQRRHGRQLLHGPRALPQHRSASSSCASARCRPRPSGRWPTSAPDIPSVRTHGRAPLGRPAPGDRALPLRPLGRAARAARRAVRRARRRSRPGAGSSWSSRSGAGASRSW